MMKAWNRAVGSHASKYDIFYENIFIENNTFDGMNDYAVTLLKAKTVKVSGNQFIDCKGGIRYLAVNKGKYSTSLAGIDKGVQAGETVIIESNDFKSIRQEDVILIKGYNGVKNQDIYVLNNTFNQEDTCAIRLIEAADVYCNCNTHLNTIYQKRVDKLFSDL